jgi:hypothetical protein
LAQMAPASLQLSDGAAATSYPHCGDADLCATIEYKNGDVLEVYSEGAEANQPYVLLFVKVHGPMTVYQYSRVVGFLPAILTMDRGLVHLTVYQNHDGTISLEFSKP